MKKSKTSGTIVNILSMSGHGGQDFISAYCGSKGALATLSVDGRKVAEGRIEHTLASQEDGSVVLAQVGFFSNFASLMNSPADATSPLTGRELIKKKVRFLSVMAGAFQTIDHNNHYLEYNVWNDLPAAHALVKEWPTPIVCSGFEIGIAVAYPAVSIERDFNYVKHHPIAEAYYLYEPPPHNRPTWDLTSVLYAVLPDRGYFDLSPPGKVTLGPDGFTGFKPEDQGRDRFLILTPKRDSKSTRPRCWLTNSGMPSRSPGRQK